MGYITPADVGISDDRAAHIARGSKEPGTDYKTAYGTDLRAPGHGRVIGVNHSNEGAAGRRLTFLMDNGEVIDFIHLAKITVAPNARVSPGQQGLALSGASGFGQDRYYGPHVHVTRRARVGLPFSQTLDFEDAIGGAPASTSSGSATPAAATISDLSQEDDMSILIRVDNGTSYSLEPFRGIKAHANTMGARLALLGRNGSWPPAEGPDFDRFRAQANSGEIQLSAQHAEWLCDVYGLASLLPLPEPGLTKYL